MRKRCSQFYNGNSWSQWWKVKNISLLFGWLFSSEPCANKHQEKQAALEASSKLSVKSFFVQCEENSHSSRHSVLRVTKSLEEGNLCPPPYELFWRSEFLMLDFETLFWSIKSGITSIPWNLGWTKQSWVLFVKYDSAIIRTTFVFISQFRLGLKSSTEDWTPWQEVGVVLIFDGLQLLFLSNW